MNPKNSIPIWIRLISIIGIFSAIVGSFGFAAILWAEMSLIDSRNDVVAIAPLAMVAWLAQLICGVIILKWSKMLGRILIWLGFIFFGSVLLFAKSK